MSNKTHKGLTALAALQTKLGNESYLDVIHEGGYCWKAYFSFGEPAVEKSIEAIKKELLIPLPVAYEQFLLHYDGAVLYYDNNYGQWGFQLYGTKDLLAQDKRWKAYYEGILSSTYMVFAKSMGDVDILLLDTSQTVEDGEDCCVIDGNSGDPPHMWRGAARSFSDWLDRLVVAQGAKYWRWY